MAVAGLRRGPREPLHFGAPEEPLFGVHHRADGAVERDAGVVLCPPLGHEYIVTHAAYRHLAERLAGEGFHVLRFDYFGCGDSAGDCEQGRPARWIEDVTRALGEIRLRSGVRGTVLFGCRLGATLAALAGAQRGDVGRMVLWDPVVSGARHVRELEERHRAMLRRAHVHPGVGEDASGGEEVLGFAFPQSMRAGIASLDLLGASRRPADEVLLVESRGDGAAELADGWAASGARVERLSVPLPDPWTWMEDASRLVPREVLDPAVRWLVGGRP